MKVLYMPNYDWFLCVLESTDCIDKENMDYYLNFFLYFLYL